MVAIKIKIILMFWFMSASLFSQEKEVDLLRLKFINKNYIKIYKNELKNNSEIEMDFETNKIYRFFKIPFKEKLKLYPFNQFNSIYITKH